MLTIGLLSPVAIVVFNYGVPIEIIVFGLLLAGYRGPEYLRGRRSSQQDDHRDAADPQASGGSDSQRDENSSSKQPAKETGGLTSWRSKLSWRSKASDGTKRGGRDSDEGSWRRRDGGDAKSRRQGDDPKKERSSGALAALKQKAGPQQQWRSLINKFTPEKFEKLCEQLLETLPKDTEGKTVTDEEFRQVLKDLLALIFEASSRQHQYTEMYTDLCQKLLEFVGKQRPELDGKSCVWEKCQVIFQTVVLKTPDIPENLPEDELMDRKAKHKEKMVGMVKFGGDLVSRGLVPCEGVMQWIHTLLSEKTQEVYAEDGTAAAREKDMEQREVQLEVLCAILASMGSSLSDSKTWSDDDRLVIEDVFTQLEQLSMDTANLSLRIRCLIRDILDLRMAHWKEKAGKLKPTMLQQRKKESDEEQGEGDEDGKGKTWMDPQLIASLQAVEHHLEVIEDKEAKLTRVKALIQLYHLIQEKQIVIVANSSSVKKVVDLIAESFKEIDFKALDFSTPEQTRKKSISAFQQGETSILVMASEVSTRRDFDFGKAATVLVNYDFPMTLQLYLYRLFKRADSNTHVYTFFSPHFDVRHTVALMAAMDGAKQKIPPALQKLKDQIKSDNSGKSKGDGGEGKPRRSPKGPETRQVSDADAQADAGDASWKSRRQGDGDVRRDDRDRRGDDRRDDPRAERRGDDRRDERRGDDRRDERRGDDRRDDRRGDDRRDDRDRDRPRDDDRWEDRRRDNDRDRDRGGGDAREKAKSGQGDWRDERRRTEGKEDSTAAPPVVLQRSRSEQGSGEDAQTRRRELLRRAETATPTTARSEDVAPEGRDARPRVSQAPSQGSARRPDGAARQARRDHGGEAPDEPGSSRHERAPWFDPALGDQTGELRRTATGRSQASTLDRPDRRADGGDSRWHFEPDRPKATVAGNSSSSAGAADRRDGARPRRQPDDSTPAADEGDREQRRLGDRPREGPSDGRTPLSRVANTATARFTPSGEALRQRAAPQ